MSRSKRSLVSGVPILAWWGEFGRNRKMRQRVRYQTTDVLREDWSYFPEGLDEKN